MAAKKRITTKYKMIDESIDDLDTTPMDVQPAGMTRRMGSHPKLLIAIVILLLVSAYLLKNKGVVVAAVVNGKPIWRWDLNNVLTARYGQQTLEGMISEQLIADEANKTGATVSKEEVAQKESEVVKGLGENVSIDDLLKYQGVTREEFDNQIKLQLTVQKILGKDIQITDDDVNNYIATNRATLVATEEAALKAEAKQAILEAKIGEKVQPWFANLKEKAKVLRFL